MKVCSVEYWGLMKLLGIVENISYKGSLIIRTKTAPEIGSKVFDKGMKPIGKVKRVFGPVSKPFLEVESLKPMPLTIIGSDVYIR